MAKRKRKRSAEAPPAEGRPAAGPWLSRRAATILSAAAIALVALAAYWNSFAGVMVFDDHFWIEHNRSIERLWPPWHIFAPRQIGMLGGRPVVSLTLALNYAVGGLNVWGYHAVNLAIHVLAALVLFGLVRRTLELPQPPRRFGPRLDSAATPLALAIALVWAVHPLQTESVTYIIQRTESLVGLFYLLALYCMLRGATATAKGAAWYVAAVASCVLGMATKEVMASAPLVVLLYDRTFLAGSFRAALSARRWLYAGLAATWGVIAWVLAATGFHGGSTGFAVQNFTWKSYLLTQPEVLLHYFRQVFWPTGLCLSYGWQAPQTVAAVVLPGLVIVALLAAICWAMVKTPAVGFLAASYFLILAPTSSFVPLRDAAFEHRLYLPLAAIAALATIAAWELIWRVWPRSIGARRFAATGALALAVVPLVCVTIRRNEDYRSEYAIWRDAVEKYPDNPTSLTNYALALNARGDSQRAMNYLQAAIDRLPGDGWTHMQLGILLASDRKIQPAEAEFRKAIELNGELAEAHLNLGTALFGERRNREALAEWRTADRLSPDDPAILTFIAWELATDRDPALRNGAEAVELAQRAVRGAEARGKSGVAFQAKAMSALAAAYAETGRFDAAAEIAEQTKRLAAEAKDAALMQSLPRQIDLYRRGLPYRQPPPTAPQPPG